MNWIYQVLSFFVAFGPVILGTLLWHFIWSDDSDFDDQDLAEPYSTTDVINSFDTR